MARRTSARPRETASEVASLREELHQEQENLQLLRESIASLERQLTDPGWQRLIAQAEQEFTPEGLRQLRAICRLYALKNPLVKRGLSLRTAYVWGQGVQISARAMGKNAKAGEQNVNLVIQEFLTAKANRRAFTGQQARERLERALGTDGEIPIVLFTRPSTGKVQIRTFNADELADIRTNPEDSSEPWFYLRQWTTTAFDANGSPVYRQEKRWYPAVDHRPRVRLPRFGDIPIAWDSPLLHVRVGDMTGYQRGIPDVYACLDWARAYKEFLEAWARLMQSLARYAWRARSPGSSKSATRAALAAIPSIDAAGQPAGVGATALLTPDAQLEAISKSGATFDADSGRPLATMVASSLDVPVTMLLSDPGQTGARATAETLDQPTEWAMTMRRNMWGDVLTRICEYVIAESVRAPKGELKGKVELDKDTNEETVVLDGETDPTVDILWPSLDDTNVGTLVSAIVSANSTGTIRPNDVLKMLLTALGVRGIDRIIDEMVDEDGVFLWPETADSRNAEDSAASASDDAPSGVAGAGQDAPEDLPVDGETPLPDQEPNNLPGDSDGTSTPAPLPVNKEKPQPAK